MAMVFRVTRDGDSRTLRFEKEVVTLGRGEGCVLPLDDPALSRTHCQFEQLGGAVYVRDLNSRNGTRLRGELVRRARLDEGDEVQVGNTRVVYEGIETRTIDEALGLKTIPILGGGTRKKQRLRDAEEVIAVGTIAVQQDDQTVLFPTLRVRARTFQNAHVTPSLPLSTR